MIYPVKLMYATEQVEGWSGGQRFSDLTVLYFCFLPLFFLRENLPGDTRSEPDGQTDTTAQTDGGPKSHPPTGWTSTKNFAFPDELEVQNILQKLSNHPLEKHGDTDSLSSYTSGLSIIFLLFS